MTIKFTCPQCGQRIETTGEAIGTIISCPDCKKNIRVGKRALGSEAPEQKPPRKATENLIHVTRDGQDFGPFEIETVNGYLQDGFLFATDLAWYKGLARWIPLSHVPGVLLPVMGESPPMPVQPVVEPRVPRAVEPVVRPPVAQSVRPTAAGQKMKASTVIGIIAIIGFALARGCSSSSSNTASSPPPQQQSDEQQWRELTSTLEVAIARREYEQQRAQNAESSERFRRTMRQGLNPQDMTPAERQDAVNRRLLNLPR